MKRMNPVIKGVRGKKRVVGWGGGRPPAVAAKVKGYLPTWKEGVGSKKPSEIGTLYVGSKPTRCMCKLTD